MNNELQPEDILGGNRQFLNINNNGQNQMIVSPNMLGMV